MSHAPATSFTLIGTTKAPLGRKMAFLTMLVSWRRLRTASSTLWRATPAIAAGKDIMLLDITRFMGTAHYSFKGIMSLMERKLL